MSTYTSKLTILRHFLKTLSMIHMPPKPIASADCDTTCTLFLCKKLTFQIKIYTQTLVSCSIFSKKFSTKYICPLNP